MPIDRDQADAEPKTADYTTAGYGVRLALTMCIVALICAVMVFAAYSQGWVRYAASIGNRLHWL